MSMGWRLNVQTFYQPLVQLIEIDDVCPAGNFAPGLDLYCWIYLTEGNKFLSPQVVKQGCLIEFFASY
jgi:hypothetical protein